MKQIICIVLLFSFFNGLSFAQSADKKDGEFTVYNNGLIYSPTTMTQLNHIVDSLNLKFKTCTPKPFVSILQAYAMTVSIKSTKSTTKSAVKDLKGGMTLTNFMKKYPSADVDTDRLIIRETYTQNDEVRLFFQEFNGKRLDLENIPTNYSNKVKDKLFIDKDQDGEYLLAFLFTTDFESKPLPDRYARMMQYADCLVDTNSTIFFSSAKRPVWYDESKEAVKLPLNLAHFTKMMFNRENFEDAPKREDFMKKKVLDTARFELAYDKWREMKYAQQDSFEKSAAFLPTLKKALEEAVRDTINSDVLEQYAEKYQLLTPQYQLFFNRNKIVVGYCSQDDSPRRHAQLIAVLAAETTNWEVFLRAHLNIMNDRFQRQSDGSYAWARRETYIKELEELGINVSDLMLGIALNAENVPDNHYFGNINRLGRALAETKEANRIEQEMLTGIMDNDLDAINRIRLYYLFLNYNYNLKDKAQQQTNKERLLAVTEKLPPYFKYYLQKEKD